MIRTDEVLIIEDKRFIKCKEIDIDKDLDCLICGACIHLTDDTFYILDIILDAMDVKS